MVNCSKCGEVVAATEKFCPKCGAAIEVAAAAKVQKIGQKTVLRVFMLDNSFKAILIDETMTTADVVRSLCDRVGFQDSAAMQPFFGLYECVDGVNVGRPLAEQEKPITVMKDWPAGGKSMYVFQARLYMDSTMNSGDSAVIHMHFIQAVYNVIHGNYPVEFKEAINLAALQVHSQFGKFNGKVHKPGFLEGKIIQYIPARWIHQKPGFNWEEAIFTEHAAIMSKKEDSQRKYLERVRRFEYYGCAFYPVKSASKQFAKYGKVLCLGIGCKGIMILTPNQKDTIETHRLNEIYRWGFKPGCNFYFEIKQAGAASGHGPTYEFETAKGDDISTLLTDYAMALLKELGVNKEGDKKKAATKVRQEGDSSSESGTLEASEEEGKEESKEEEKVEEETVTTPSDAPEEISDDLPAEEGVGSQ
eukprot:TRINITY_DN183592_c0_g1_i1.p1 TRINITY_DN183592_c0_g1~~TRINITY_DN183592_c0_g1_i1.p1  ORF type:complete len:427 (+),score=150.95 TRINITY_DN183592_c0_g1_i1:30-1283(+)